MRVICKILFWIFLDFYPKFWCLKHWFAVLLFFLFKVIIHDIIHSVGNVGLEVFLLLHKWEFHKDFFDNLCEFEFIGLLLVVGFEYFSGEELNKVKDKLVISLLLVSGSKSRINRHCKFLFENNMIFDIYLL